MTVDRYELALALLGVAALVAAWLPAYTERRPLSLPVVLVGGGALLFLLPLGLPTPDPRGRIALTERLTELVVIVSLMGAGLRIDRPFGWRAWSTTWRLLVVAMPLTIAATAVAGWAIGLPVASALLLGASLAPTDPVLASDVQVGEPTIGLEAGPGPAADDEDEVRFALTSEGGLNDALAFPFVYLALRMADDGSFGVGDALRWVGFDLAGRVLIGAAVGLATGRLLGRIAFRPPGRLTALAETRQGFVAVAATLLAYGAAELLQGYGFLAVFVAAVALRGAERRHEYHGELHGFTEQAENLLVVGLLLAFGGAVASGLLADVTPAAILAAVLLVFVVRPLTGSVALVGSGLSRPERIVVAFFGIRGFGSLYYLAYGLAHAPFEGAGTLWSVVALAMLLSIATHGITATPALQASDRAVRRR